jgi:hypothetical protein
MAKYVIEAPHIPEECLNDLDEMSAKAPEILSKFVWGCAQGEHKGWAYIDAVSKEEIISALPKSVQGKVKVTEVEKLTPEQIKSFHEK